MSTPQSSRAKGITLGDATVTEEDILLLTPPNWLNDNLISFWCEHLRINVLQNDPRILFILPNIAFFLLQCTDETDIEAVTSGLSLETRELVIAPLNNSSDDGSFAKSGASGTHWSVLIYTRSSNAFYTFDSVRGGNRVVESNFARKLAPILQKANKTGAPTVIKGDSPEQNNSYDCGVHVCSIMEYFVQQLRDGKEVPVAVPTGVCMQQKREAIRAAILTRIK